MTLAIRLFASALLMVMLMSASAFAGDVLPYKNESFDKLIADGKIVLIEAHADWCPTCQLQAPAVVALAHTKPYEAVTVLVVDFDKQEDALKRFNITKQSTLVVFKGKQERGRSIGVTDKADIAALMDKALR